MRMQWNTDPVGNGSETGSTRPLEDEMTIFENMYEDWVYWRNECIATSSNISFKIIFNVQPLNRVDELLATTANSLLCWCVVFAGSETEESATRKFRSL